MSYIATWANEKINKNEIAKLEKDGLAVFDDLPELVKRPFSEISKDYFMYFKYAGLTVQKPQTDGLFMMRIKLPAGIINNEQGRKLVEIAQKYAHGIVDITTRQSVQYHHIPFAKLTQIFASIESVGLTTRGAEGDINRNVIGNPLAGIDENELFDATSTLLAVHKKFQENTDFSNLPRKFKISVSSNYYNSANAEINDLAFFPATKQINGRNYKGFGVKVGGGLGAKPYLAKTLDLFVKRHQVVKVSEAVVALYRDYGYRRSRSKARLKFLIEDWGVERFSEELKKRVGKLESAGVNRVIGWNNGLVLGVHQQKQRGFSYIGVSVPTGRLEAVDLASFVAIAKQYGTGEIRFDHSQNLIIPFLPNQQLSTIIKLPIFAKFPIETSRFQDYGLTCTGNEFCNLAYTNTKNITRDLLAHLDEKYQLEQPIRIILTGCMNACAHRNIADIGIQGIAGRDVNRQPIETFQIAIGGSLLAGGHFNEEIKGRVPKSLLIPVISDLVGLYLKERIQNESFYQTFQRTGTEPFQNQLIESLAAYE
ncbi:MULTISPECIES: nitrite/sulfite reductase [unclassified Enterococcus]|uniref:nitrite/sulfite reductase n=1 Tax=unclassified Enterococcus TaxID=2608891 RepID=UPI001555A57B|nr:MULTISPECIES: nitrite/sulfite reductase [unclassified Enterococcus]MBS7576402.1 nitrite/sulfite reductase [Enterococcus sp. MMGLQ5-2]MBS7583634.1 nitrite/sulfite reductase [Enterococcus sp. MMGLQ5-1]NPD11495.1 nitrite/sulfite reductase [Enterococcus sp. MMGLQ5-1]NPD36239.1 nitrite/sulfite reductase [Enterococcus sp. MMGLQ5-2]